MSMLNLEDGVFEVKATSGDTHLGGEDFNTRLMDYFIEELAHTLSEEHVDEHIKNNDRALRKLRNDAERMKKALSM